jgi:hypothetical protein
VRRAALMLLLLAFGTAACGGDKKEEEAAAERGAKAACEGSPLSGKVSLPAGFPKPAETTYTKQSTAGPSSIVDGYYEGELEDAYDAYKDALGKNGYTVLFDELEEDDSEVSWKGQGRSGQIALRKECDDSDRIYVHITNRPA